MGWGGFASDRYTLPHLHGLSVIHWTCPNTRKGALISYHIPWGGNGEKETRQRLQESEREREGEKKVITQPLCSDENINAKHGTELGDRFPPLPKADSSVLFLLLLLLFVLQLIGPWVMFSVLFCHSEFDV